MVDVSPFRAWRYDLSQVGDLSEVTAPPYDVISPAERDALYEKHPCNVIRLILNREEPGDTSEAKYQRAASLLKHWMHDGVLLQERAEAIYVYHQTFEWEGRPYTRRGFLTRMRLEEFGTGKVFPHEQTMPGPKADRLALTKACRMNLSPIFGLFSDDGSEVQNLLEDAVRGTTALEATDHLGVVHRLWILTDHAVVGRVRESLRDKPVFIADGHHRYETALKYRNDLRAEGRLKDDNAPPNFVLTMLIGMSDPGLVILPTHRLVSGLPAMTSGQLTQCLAGHFELEAMGRGPTAAQETWDMIAADGGQNVFGFGTTADGEWLFARAADTSPMAQLAADHSEAWRELGVSILHKLVLDHLLVGGEANLKPQFRYVHRLDEVTDALSRHECQLACLVPPAGIEHVEHIASQLETMPPKSTYFYPKLLSGLVFNPLE